MYTKSHTLINMREDYVMSYQSHHDTGMRFFKGICGDGIVKSRQNSSNQSPQALTYHSSVSQWCKYVALVVNNTTVIITQIHHNDQRHYQPPYLTGPDPIRSYIHTYILHMYTVHKRPIVQPGAQRKS